MRRVVAARRTRGPDEQIVDIHVEIYGRVRLVRGLMEVTGSRRRRPASSLMVVSTSDEPALMLRQAAYLTLAIAEYFRDLGKDCWC